MIAIRVDGNSEIATGHVMRCIAIANGLKELKQDCMFIVADERSEELLKSSGFTVLVLHSIWNDMDTEIDAILCAVQKHHIEKILVDSYFVTQKYLSALESVCHVIYIDDLNTFQYPVSALINYNLSAHSTPYNKLYAGTNTQIFLGPAYAPLRTEFQNLAPRARAEIKNVLITVGGVDTYNAAGQIVKKILQDPYFSNMQFHIVAGRLNHHLPELEKLSKEHTSVVIHQNVSKMSELMLACDLAVTAGGSTTYELCACGVPSVCFSCADNQLMLVKAFSENGLMISAGDIRSDADVCVSRIIDGLKRYCEDSNLCLEICKKVQEMVDGNGVKRLSEVIIGV